MRHTGNVDAGFKFLTYHGIEIDEETEERVLNAYGWLVWSKYKDENYSLEEDDFGQIQIIIALLLQLDDDFHKTLTSRLFSIVFNSKNWKLVNDFCDHFTPDMLSEECEIFQVKRKGQMKDTESASDVENWYVFKTKALMNLRKWQECFDKSEEALGKLKKFHHSNDIWFLRRIALSKKNLGNAEDAIKILKNILRKKKEWFVQKELAELYFEKEDFQQAFKLAIDAVNNSASLEFKVDLLYLIGRIHQKKNEPDLAFKHFSLSKLIYQEKKWKVPQKVFDELKKFENAEINPSDTDRLKSELKKYWNSFEPDAKGEIIKVMHDNEKGKDGFLKCNGKDVYFSLSPNFHLTPKIELGTKVEFAIVPSKDGKREQARIIKIIEG